MKSVLVMELREEYGLDDSSASFPHYSLAYEDGSGFRHQKDKGQ